MTYKPIGDPDRGFIDVIHASNETVRIIKELFTEMLPTVSQTTHEHNARAILARMAQADPPILCCHPDEVIDSSIEEE